MYLEGIQAVIFDMDGLLLDSEGVSLQAFTEACKEFDQHADLDKTLDVYKSGIGGNLQLMRQLLQSGLPTGFPLDDVFSSWRERYELAAETTHALPLMAGVSDILALFSDLSLPMAVATSSKYRSALIKLNNAGIMSFFSHVVGGDQVEKGKPEPEIYLRAAAALNIHPSNCLAFEDSDNGTKAAVSAGMRVIQIPNLITPKSETVALGHHIEPSMFEVVKKIHGSIVV